MSNKMDKHSIEHLFDEKEELELTAQFSLKPKKKKKRRVKKVVLIITIIVILLVSMGLFLLYGPYSKFRNWLITTATTTMNHQYLATMFYNDKTIQNVLAQNRVIEPSEDTNSALVQFVNYDTTISTYKNKYDKQILSKTKGNNDYKLIKIKGDGLRGYLVAIYNPAKVKIATASTMGNNGQMLTTISKNNKALVAINASGFVDPNYSSNGSTPHGVVIKDSQIVSNNQSLQMSGGIIGFNKENKLILSRQTGEQALSSGIRDAVEFGPFLIINGKKSFIKGNGGWGDAPRTAIGQRKDGIVLFLVMDGRDYTNKILGADMVDLTEIMSNYGAINAANMDGGTSSGLTINNTLINKPISGTGKKTTRAIPDAWIVTK